MVGNEVLSPEDDEETPLEQIVAGAVMGVTFLVGFSLMFAGFPFFWVAFVVGFAGVLPMALGFVKLYERRQRGVSQTASEEDALDELRARYARGELSDEEFERRVERLLETESLADAQAYIERPPDRRTAGTHTDDREYELESDRN